MKMMFHIDDFKCTLCANWFCPPFNLPYLLPCTHSICTSCLQKASNHDHIICPQDLEACPIQSININQTTKKALQRLMKQHKNYNQNTQLQCIKSLSIGFDEVLSSKQKNLRNLEALIDQIFNCEIDRLKYLHEKVKTDINRPYRIVEDWKQIVANHLTTIRKNHNSSNTDTRSNGMLQLNHYIQEGRKIKMELNQFFQLQFDLFADKVMRNPRVCFQKDFSINMQTLQKKLKCKINKQSQFMKTDLSTNNKTSLNTQIQYKQQKLKKEKIFIHSQPQVKAESQQLIQNPAVLVENKRQANKRPLNNVDMNKMTNIKKIDNKLQQQNEKTYLQTKRENNKQKNNYNKSLLVQPNCNLDRYIGLQGEKNQKNNLNNTIANDKQNKNDFKIKGKNSAVSPKRVIKNYDNFLNKNNNKNQSKHSISKYDSKNSQNSIEKKQDEYNPNQYQTDMRLTQNGKNKNKSNKLKQMISPYKTKTKGGVQKQSPYRLSSSQVSQIQRMNKLAHMLDNTSNNASNNPSNYNSYRNGPSSNISKSKTMQNVQTKSRGGHHSSLQTNSLLMSPNTIRQQYTQQGQSEKIQCFQQQLLNNNQELLINDSDRNQENGWYLGNINFLKQWKIKNENNQEQPLQIRQNTYYYNCQKQKLSYMRKMQIHRVQQAYKLTLIKDNFIQLINQSLHDVDMNLFLSQFDWKHSNIQIVKFVKTSLNDEQLNILLNFLIKSNVKALVLSGNNLTDVCLDAFLNFVTVNNVLKNVYLPKNYINIMKSKTKINLLKQKGVNIYV